MPLVELRVGGKQLAFAEIIIGPNQEITEAQRRLIVMLEEAGYKAGAFEYPKITASTIQPWKQRATAQ